MLHPTQLSDLRNHTYRLCLFLLMLAGTVTSATAQIRELSYPCPDAQKLIIPRSGLARTAAGAADSRIVVSGAPGESMFNVSVQIRLFNPDRLTDLDIVVVGPQGQKVLVMSDAGGTRDGTPITSKPVVLKFSDSAQDMLSEQIFAYSSIFLPTNYGTGDILPAPAPPPPYQSSTSTFTGNPNGTWRLYAFDDSGSVAQDTQILDWRVYFFTEDSDSIDPPAPDDFSNALSLPAQSSNLHIQASGVAPTLQFAEPELCLGEGDASCVNRAKGSVWLKYTPQEDGVFRFQFDRDAYVENNSYEYSHMLALYTGSGLSNLAPVTAGYDELSAEVIKDVTYYVRVDGYGEDCFWDVYATYAFLAGSSISPTQTCGVTSTFNGYQMLFYDFDFNDTQVTPYAHLTAQHPYKIRTGWIGMFLYDYLTSSFSEAIYCKLNSFAPGPSPPASSSASSHALRSLHVSPKTTGAGARLTFNQTIVSKKDVPESTGYQLLVYNYTTAAQSISPYMNGATGTYDFPMPVNDWIGIFHYDYLSAQFREFDQRLKLEM